MLDRIDRDVASVAVLEDELRRRMYLFVRGLGRPASRDEVAEAVGVSRKLAAFHLDKLLDRGLLTASYARPPGRSGRGAGRTAKYYEPSDREFEVTIPERRYDLMGSILVSALDDQLGGESTHEAALRAAHERGERIGHEERTRRRLPPPGVERSISVAREILASCGYEPYADDGGLRLRSCPFHALAQERREVVCSLNRELIEGIVEGLGSKALRAEPDPAPGECCVRLSPMARSADR